MRARVLACVALLIVAGCLGNDTSNDGASLDPRIDLASVYDFEHDHADPVLHQTAWRFQQVALDALTGGATPSGVAGEIDVAGQLAVIHIQGERSGFVTVDISEPTAPRFLAFTDASAYRPFEARDVKLDPAGGYAYLALQLSSPDPHGGGTSAGGFLVYSLADPAAPTLVGQAAEAGRGCHMIRYWEDGATRVVYCASSQGLAIWSLDETPQSPRTPVKRGTWVPPDPATASERVRGSVDPGNPLGTVIGAVTTLQPHDMTAQFDPVSGAPILVVAYEIYGILTLDIADPLLPQLLSWWDGTGATHFDRVHTALVGTLDARRIAIGVTEVFGDRIPGLYFVDVSDWAAPMLVGEWYPPNGTVSRNGLFSTHNIQLVGNTLYMAHFHAGVFTFDVSEPEHPRVTGVFSRQQPNIAETLPLGGAPAYWDVVVHDGYTLATDTTAGLLVLHHDGDPIGDPGWSSWV